MSTLKTKFISAPINGATVEKLTFQTNNTDRVVINESGNVGVGTGSPSTPLDVVGTSQAYVFSLNPAINTATPQTGVMLYQLAGVGASIASFQISFVTGANNARSERFRIGDLGQLGVAGANYGTAGQVLTSGGASAAPSWTTISSAPTNAQILSGVASANAGDVGSYALMARPGGGTNVIGGSYAGSGLRYSDTGSTSTQSAASGTWRMMGCYVNSNTTVYMRIA